MTFRALCNYYLSIYDMTKTMTINNFLLLLRPIRQLLGLGIIEYKSSFFHATVGRMFVLESKNNFKISRAACY